MVMTMQLFDLQWWRLRYALLMRPNKAETAVQYSRMSCVFGGFSGQDNSIYNNNLFYNTF